MWFPQGAFWTEHILPSPWNKAFAEKENIPWPGKCKAILPLSSAPSSIACWGLTSPQLVSPNHRDLFLLAPPSHRCLQRESRNHCQFSRLLALLCILKAFALWEENHEKWGSCCLGWRLVHCLQGGLVAMVLDDRQLHFLRAIEIEQFLLAIGSIK